MVDTEHKMSECSLPQDLEESWAGLSLLLSRQERASPPAMGAPHSPPMTLTGASLYSLQALTSVIPLETLGNLGWYLGW